MNQYETVFILTPVLSDDQMKETAEKFKKVLTDKGAEIINEEAWGLKKMAYAIQKKHQWDRHTWHSRCQHCAWPYSIRVRW